MSAGYPEPEMAASNGPSLGLAAKPEDVSDPTQGPAKFSEPKNLRTPGDPGGPQRITGAPCRP